MAWFTRDYSAHPPAKVANTQSSVLLTSTYEITGIWFYASGTDGGCVKNVKLGGAAATGLDGNNNGVWVDNPGGYISGDNSLNGRTQQH